MFDIFYTFYYFFIYYLIYWISFLGIIFYITQTLKFFIKQLIGYDLWTYSDNGFRSCQNNSFYDIEHQFYSIDYYQFDIIEMIYYHHNFLEPKMLDSEQHFYYDWHYESRVREDDDHDLYGFMSAYIVPLQHQYYLLEHYWPSDDYGSFFNRFHNDFFDLEYEYKFISQNYKILWPIYLKYLNSRETIYKENLYESKILQYYFNSELTENLTIYAWSKAPRSFLTIPKDKQHFWKKEVRTFELLPPPKELCFTNYMIWFILQSKYDEAKFDYDMFCGLSPYELFDKTFYEIFVTGENNLIDLHTKRYQYIENIDDYYPDYINSDNSLNYSFDINFLFTNYQQLRVKNFEFDFDKPNDPFDFFSFFFIDRFIIIFHYLLLIVFYSCVFFLFCVCYYCWFNYYTIFDPYFREIPYIRLLTRSVGNYLYNDTYNSYRDLVFHFNNIDQSSSFIFEKNKNILLGFAEYQINNIIDNQNTEFFRGSCRNIELEREYKLMRQRQTAYLKFNPLYEKQPQHIFFGWTWVKKMYPHLSKPIIIPDTDEERWKFFIR